LVLIQVTIIEEVLKTIEETIKVLKVELIKDQLLKKKNLLKKKSKNK